MQPGSHLLALSSLLALAVADSGALELDDECLATSDCAVNALQLQAMKDLDHVTELSNSSGACQPSGSVGDFVKPPADGWNKLGEGFSSYSSCALRAKQKGFAKLVFLPSYQGKPAGTCYGFNAAWPKISHKKCTSTCFLYGYGSNCKQQAQGSCNQWVEGLGCEGNGKWLKLSNYQGEDACQEACASSGLGKLCCFVSPKLGCHLRLQSTLSDGFEKGRQATMCSSRPAGTARSSHYKPPVPAPRTRYQHPAPAPPTQAAQGPTPARSSDPNPLAKMMDPNIWKDPDTLKKLMDPNTWKGMMGGR